MLAKERMAPQLYGYQEFSGVGVIVMELLEDVVHFNTKTHDHLKDRVRAAVKLMHYNGWVHGDVRDANIMVMDGEVFLIDIDWAGRPGEANSPRYPAALNKNIWTELVRLHTGIGPGCLITKEHDEFMLSRLLGP